MKELRFHISIDDWQKEAAGSDTIRKGVGGGGVVGRRGGSIM